MKRHSTRQNRKIKKTKESHKSTHLAILKGLFWVALFVFLGKIAGAAKEMAIAYRYGVSEHVDAYLFLFNLITWPIAVWFSVITYILPPIAAKLSQSDGNALVKFRAELLAFSLLLGIIVAQLFWFGLPLLFKTTWLGLSPKTISIASGMIAEIASLAPFGILVGLFSTWLLSSGRHVNTLLESVPALSILLAVLLLPEFGIKALAWGTVAGYAIHMLALMFPLARHKEIELPRFTSKSEQWPYFWKGFGILLIGSALSGLNTIVDQFFAAKLDTGSISIISYANRILALILGLGATAIARATLPVFSKMKSQNSGNLQRIAMFWVNLMLLLGLLTAAISWWLAPWMVKLLFERGAFKASNTLIVVDLFRDGLFQVPFYFAALTLVTLLASHGKHKLMAISGTSNLLVKAVANYYLLPIYGVNAMMLSSGVMYFASFVLLYLFAQFGLKKSN
jgi:putative peptidoglycan lipid II flippase